MQQSNIQFGYWNNKGTGEPIRWLLAHLNLPFTEYNPKNFDEWFQKDKSVLGGNFPAMPFLKDGEVTVAEVGPIAHYLCSKYNKNLLGKDPRDEATIMMIEGVIGDIKSYAILPMIRCESPTQELNKVLAHDDKVYAKLKQLSHLLGEKEFLLGYFSWADILLVCVTDMISALCESLKHYNVIEAFRNLNDLSKRVHSLPGIKARFESSLDLEYLPSPLLNFKMKTEKDIIDKRKEMESLANAGGMSPF